MPEETFDPGWLRRSLESAATRLGDLWAVDRSQEYLDSLVEFREIDSTTQVFRLGTIEPFDHPVSLRRPDDVDAWRADVERHLAELRAEGARLAAGECDPLLEDLAPLLATRPDVFGEVVGSLSRIRFHLDLETVQGLDRLDRALESWEGASATGFAVGWQRPAARVCARQLALLGHLGDSVGTAGQVVRLGQLSALGAVRAVEEAALAQLRERAGRGRGDPTTFLSAVSGATGMLAGVTFAMPGISAALAVVSAATQSISAAVVDAGSATQVVVDATTSGALVDQLHAEVARVLAAVRAGLDDAHRAASGHRHALGLLDSAGALVVPAPRLDPRVDPADFHHESVA